MKPFILSVTLCAAVLAQTPTPATKAPATKAPATATKAPASKTGAAKAPATKAPATVGNLLDPATLKATAPAVFKAKLTTTKGDIVIEVTREWAPRGADRFYNLVRAGFFTDAYFFRVIPGFMCQFGVSSRPEVSRVWSNNNMIDDPVKQSNTRGMVTYAKTNAPNSRSTQLFINYGNNAANLDPLGFAPFGKVVEGMEVAEQFFSGYNAQFGGDSGQLQGPIGDKGKVFVEKEFPKLDKILRASIVPATPAAPGATKSTPSTTKSATKAPATKAPATKTPDTKKQ
ncbi:MAG TPA: peptidylprolyl isomerase [Bryobacteraceae bacterium]|jgi:peptidyl-prolyl cis-trans isomerase A (cyclophilin A)|nr:peptidylprolyl isomerase [Bryobacteraceae bacterium]